MIICMPLRHAAHAVTCNLACKAGTYCDIPATTGGTGTASCTKCPDGWPNSDEDDNGNIYRCYKKCDYIIDLHMPKGGVAYNPNNCEKGNTCVENANGPSADNICTCKPGYVATPAKTACNPGIYEITLDPNNPDSDSSAVSTIYLKYNVGYADSRTATNFSAPFTLSEPKRKKYYFRGYSNAAGTTMTDADNNIRVSNTTTTTADTTWYAKWEGLPYTICYYSSDSATSEPPRKTTRCKIGTACILSADALANNQKDNIISDGNWLKTWRFQDNDTPPMNLGSELPTKYEPENPSTTSSCGIKLVAQTEICPVGYYCTGGEKHACPGGATTSKMGATSRKDCIFTRIIDDTDKENVTKFCDDFGGCFYLPKLKSGNGQINI